MDTRWRAPDRRYRAGWRWTPRGRRAVRKWTFLAVLWFVVVLGLQSGVVDLLYTVWLAGYAVHRVRRNRRELRQLSQPAASPPLAPGPPLAPWPAPVGEVRQRQSISRDVRQQVWVRDGGRCRHCGITDAEAMARDGEHLHYDHIVPFSRNGADTAANLQLLCGPCNRRKSASYVG